VLWSSAAGLLLLPLLATRITDGVAWGLADFVLGGALVFGAGILCELAVWMSANRAYRAAVGVAVATAFVLVWANLAVGIIGSEDNPVNLMYWGLLALAVVAAGLARCRSDGMARAMLATAIAQALVAVIASMAGWGSPASGPLEILTLNGVFVALWLVSARLFQKAVAEQASPASVC
jgi:hypothetical protein